MNGGSFTLFCDGHIRFEVTEKLTTKVYSEGSLEQDKTLKSIEAVIFIAHSLTPPPRREGRQSLWHHHDREGESEWVSVLSEVWGRGKSHRFSFPPRDAGEKKGWDMDGVLKSRKKLQSASDNKAAVLKTSRHLSQYYILLQYTVLLNEKGQ